MLFPSFCRWGNKSREVNDSWSPGNAVKLGFEPRSDPFVPQFLTPQFTKWLHVHHLSGSLQPLVRKEAGFPNPLWKVRELITVRTSAQPGRPCAQPLPGLWLWTMCFPSPGSGSSSVKWEWRFLFLPLTSNICSLFQDRFFSSLAPTTCPAIQVSSDADCLEPGSDFPG